MLRRGFPSPGIREVDGDTGASLAKTRYWATGNGGIQLSFGQNFLLTTDWMFSGLIRHLNNAGGANGNLTTPTGTQMTDASPFDVEDGYRLHVANLGTIAGNDTTMVAGVDVTISGSAVIPYLTQGTFIVWRTGTNTWQLVRVAS